MSTGRLRGKLFEPSPEGQRTSVPMLLPQSRDHGPGTPSTLETCMFLGISPGKADEPPPTRGKEVMQASFTPPKTGEFR